MVSGYGTSQASESQYVFTDNQKGTITAGPITGTYYLTAAGENTPAFVSETLYTAVDSLESMRMGAEISLENKKEKKEGREMLVMKKYYQIL